MSRTAILRPSGFFWTGIISVIAAPLAFYRSMVLGSVTDDGAVVGVYSVILILIEIISTFVLLGGGTVVINYVAKLHEPGPVAGFLARYTALNVLLLAIATVAVISIPFLAELLIGQAGISLGHVVLLAPFVTLGTIGLFALSGLKLFALSGILTNLQMLLVCSISTIMLWGARDFFAQNAFLVLLATIITSYAIIIASALRGFANARLKFAYARKFPAGFWPFTLTIHINSICNFAHRSGDQVFVLSALGIHELGCYFIAIQLADLIVFLPLRTAQVMLARFSSDVREGAFRNVEQGYSLLVRVISFIAGVLALILIFFAQPAVGIFGEWAAEKFTYVQYLAVIAVVGCLNSVNSMLIMASESTKHYLVANVTQMLIQLTLTMVLIKPYEVYGVIAAKLVGMTVLQAGLFHIISHRLPGLKVKVSWHYFFTVAVAVVALIVATFLSEIDWVTRVTVFCMFLGAFLLVLQVGARDFRALLLRG